MTRHLLLLASVVVVGVGTAWGQPPTPAPIVQVEGVASYAVSIAADPSGRYLVRVTIQAAPGPTPPPPAPVPGPVPPPGPAPAPTPPPQPTPTPTPVVGKVWVILIYDFNSLQTLPNSARDIRTSTTLGPALSQMDATLRVYDSNTLTDAKWVGIIRSAGLPALVVLDAAGNPIHAGPLPANEAEIIAAVKRRRGAA